jgi:tetratricopeptide (TPR) repeat protein
MNICLESIHRPVLQQRDRIHMSNDLQDRNRQSESIYSAESPGRRQYLEQDSLAGKSDSLNLKKYIYRLGVLLVILLLGAALIYYHHSNTGRGAEADGLISSARQRELAAAPVAVPRSDQAPSSEFQFMLHDYADFSPVEIPRDGPDRIDINWIQQLAWHLTQGERLYRWKDWSDALREYGQAARIMPELAGLNERIGLCHFWLKNYEQAAAYFDLALKTSPDSPGLLNNMGLAMIYLGDHEAAEKHISRALAIDDRYSPAYFNLGLSKFRRGDMNAAANAFRDFVSFEPENENAIHLFSQALMRAGRWDEAVVVLHSSLLMMPKAVPLHFRLAEALVKKGSLDAAMDTLQRALALTDAKSGITWLSQGGYDPLRQRADFQQLLAELNKAL